MIRLSANHRALSLPVNIFNVCFGSELCTNRLCTKDHCERKKKNMPVSSRMFFSPIGNLNSYHEKIEKNKMDSRTRSAIATKRSIIVRAHNLTTHFFRASTFPVGQVEQFQNITHIMPAAPSITWTEEFLPGLPGSLQSSMSASCDCLNRLSHLPPLLHPEQDNDSPHLPLPLSLLPSLPTSLAAPGPCGAAWPEKAWPCLY